MDAEEFIEEFRRRRDNGLEPQESFRRKQARNPLSYRYEFSAAMEDLDGSALHGALLNAVETDALYGILSLRYTGDSDIVQHCYDDWFRPCVENGLVGDALTFVTPPIKRAVWVFCLYADRDIPDEERHAMTERREGYAAFLAGLTFNTTKH